MNNTDTHFDIGQAFYLDLGSRVAFLSFEDINNLGQDISKWPSVPKERNIQRIGALVTGKSLTSDRYSAAQAYAAMLERSGESKATQAAARWLGMESTGVSYQAEVNIRSKLRRVSHIEEAKEMDAQRPAFTSPPDIIAAHEESKEYAFGLRPSTKSVLIALINICKASHEGWVPYCTGGRALGFTEGDYDFVMVNSNKNALADHLKMSLMALSNKGVARTNALQNGELITIPDYDLGSSTVSVDVVISRHGDQAAAKVVLQGLFWSKILSDKDNMDFFVNVRMRARACGIVDGAGGMMNMWSVMITGLEYLAIERIVVLATNKPLARQSPSNMGMSSEELADAVKGYFVWMADRLADPSHVFGSFAASSKWSNRPTSEFAQSASFRVCRDPFSHRVDNCMRTIAEMRLPGLIRRVSHAAYCHLEQVHSFPGSSILDRSTSFGEIMKPMLTTPGNCFFNTMYVMKVREMVVCYTSPALGYGVSRNEVDARARAIQNSCCTSRSDVDITVGEALYSEIGPRIGLVHLVSMADRLWLSEPDEGGTFTVGACELDYGRDSRQMFLMDRTTLEILLQWMAQKVAKEDLEVTIRVWKEKIGAIESLVSYSPSTGADEDRGISVSTEAN
jgi:hypothetical protein